MQDVHERHSGRDHVPTRLLPVARVGSAKRSAECDEACTYAHADAAMKRPTSAVPEDRTAVRHGQNPPHLRAVRNRHCHSGDRP